MPRRLALLGLLVGSPALAEPLTLAEVLAGVEAANPGLIRSSLSVDAAEESVRSARGYLDPRLSSDLTWKGSAINGFFQGFRYESSGRSWTSNLTVGGTTPVGTQYALTAAYGYAFRHYLTEFEQGPTESEEDSFTTALGVAFKQPLLKGLTLRWNEQGVTRALRGLDVAELSREKTRQDTLAGAATAFWTWAWYVEQVRIAEHQIEVAEEALRVGRARLELGDIAQVDLTRLQTSVLQRRQVLVDAQTAAEAGANQVLLLLGRSPADEVTPGGTLDAGDVPAVDETTAITVALAQNLDLAILRTQLELARFDQRIARQAVLPDLSLLAGTGVANQDEDPGRSVARLFGEDAYPYVQAGAQLSVALGNRGLRGQRERAAISADQIEVQLREAELGLQGQVEQQVRAIAQARVHAELADEQLELARQTLDAEEALQEAGEAIEQQVLDARTAVFAAELEAARRGVGIQLAHVELLRLQGQVDLAR